MHRFVKEIKFEFNELVYLASPYAHTDKNTMFCRASAAGEATSQLLLMGIPVFGSIAHSEAVGKISSRRGYRSITPEEWSSLNLLILQKCKKVVVLTLDGWQDSRGIQKEIDFAKKNGIPVLYFSERDIRLAAEKYGCLR